MDRELHGGGFSGRSAEGQKQLARNDKKETEEGEREKRQREEKGGGPMNRSGSVQIHSTLSP